MYIYTKTESIIPRAIVEEAKFALTQFRALCITGPRQSGKTMLSKLLFKGKPYVNFEDSKPVLDVLTNMLSGGYPEIWSEKLNPQKWLISYIQTYMQRDVRQIKNISNLAQFSRFVFLCANHAGQILNRDELSRQIGVDTKTIQSWLGLLENSYILFRLQPWHNNLNKRIIKSPKLYFYGTGLLCTLLNISSKTGLKNHAMAGAIFENWCISEIKKNKCNLGENNDLFYFRDNLGNEIDLIIEKETAPLAVEMKSSSKPDRTLLKGLKYWKKYQPNANGILLYQGTSTETGDMTIPFTSWEEIDLMQ